MFRLVLSVFIFLVSASTSALELYANFKEDYRYLTAENACQALAGTARNATSTYADFHHVEWQTSLTYNKKQVGFCYNMYYDNAYPENLYGPVYSKLYGYITTDCDTGTEWDESAGSCITPAPTPEQCAEQGDYFDPPSQTCVPVCTNGALNNSCLVEPDPQCSPTSEDYLGTAGFGDDQRYVCSGESTCPAGQSYAFSEGSDGSYVGVCVSDSQNPPVCPGGFESVLEIYEDGFACGVTNEEATDPNRNNTSDGDSDGDGVADDTGMAGQLQDIKGLLKDGNVTRDNIAEAIKKGFGDVVDGLGGSGGGASDPSATDKTEIVGEDGNAISWSGGAIAMEVKDGLTELNAVQGEYETLIANIRSEMSASFGSFTGAGGLQDNNITLFGQTFNAGLSKFGADLSMIGSIILFAASFAALGIIMGARD